MKLKRNKKAKLPPSLPEAPVPVFPFPKMEQPEEPERAIPEEFLLPKIPKQVPPPIKPEMKAQKQTPPLFIKVSRYKDIVQQINQLKSYILGLRDTIDALTEIQVELNNALKLANRALDHINSTAASIDARMTAIQEPDERLELPSEPGAPPSDIESCIKDLYHHMEKIKSELKSISPE